MSKINIWKPTEIKKNLVERLRNAKEERKYFEPKWRANERLIYTTNGSTDLNADLSLPVESLDVVTSGEESQAMAVNYAFKNFRLIHAQLSANPPSVVPRPTSSDPKDRRAADAADRLIRHGMRKYKLSEIVDKTTLYTLLYGSGVSKVTWDPHGGRPLSLNEETGEFLMEGDICIKVPDIWNIFIDPDADTIEGINYIFEKITMDYQEAIYRWPDKKDLLEKCRIKNEQYANSVYNNQGDGSGPSSYLRSGKYDVVEIYEYWERGLASNGFVGRYCLCSKDGDLIEGLFENPEKDTPEKGLPIAVLPYVFLTDIDVPNKVWAKSFVEYNVSLQDNLNRLTSAMLDNVEAHGVARLVLMEGSEIADDSITNSPHDIIKVTGSQPPSYMAPMSLPSAMSELMAYQERGINDMSGTNESMFGQQSRETSGFSMQYATQQGNMIRRRLFNKYVAYVEGLYTHYLRVIKNNWSTARNIQVLGNEKAFQSMDIKGADVMGGYSFVSEYGNSLSLDPLMRREEIITLMPLLKEAQVNPRQILGVLKLNDLENIYDTVQLANDRQREIIEEMTTRNIYIQPEYEEDHANMLNYLYYYVMTSEFKYLSLESKTLVRQHLKAREEMLASKQQPPQVPGQAMGAEPMAEGELDINAISPEMLAGL